MSDSKIQGFGDPDRPWTLPEVDLARQAIGPLRGYVYQLHQSAAAWIELQEGDLLHLEVAEDFSEILRDPSKLEAVLQATQVKDTRELGSVTLNSADVIDAIKALFRLRMENPGREVCFRFLTTSEIGKERKNPLPSGTRGLDAWRDAAAGGAIAELRLALLSRIEAGELRTFIERSSDEQLRIELLQPLIFACGAGGWEIVEAANRQRLAALHEEVRSTVSMAYDAYDAVFAHVIRVILLSQHRELDRRELITCLQRATAIAVPSQVVVDFLGSYAVRNERKPIELADLTALARALLEFGSPPSITARFPEATPVARRALDAAAGIKRIVVETGNLVAGQLARATISELPAMSAQRHLIVGSPGSGKSHATWRVANEMLKTEIIVPLLLQVGQLNTWSEVTSLIADLAPHLSIDAVLGDQRVCCFIDGWSEFANRMHVGEKRKALTALRNTRVIANGKFADIGDTTFKTWSLEPLAVDQVAGIMEMARSDEPPPSHSMLDLLRLPLLLSICVLSGARASQTGELLRQFHRHLAQQFPDEFTEALAGAVAAVALANDRSFGRLLYELQKRAAAKNLVESASLLGRLGTISERGSQAIPVHELYWNWLAGRGLLEGRVTTDAIDALHTRESYALALQSGVRANDEHIRDAANDDLILAAALDASQRSNNPNSTLAGLLDRALADNRLAVRSRGGLAALALERSQYLRRALDVLSELSRAKLYLPAWREALRPSALFPNRAIVADWMGSDGSGFVLDAIAERGGPEWVPWLEQMALSGKIAWIDALAAALACSPAVPGWGESHLEELLRSKPWRLKAAAARRSNLILAHRIAANYERLLESVIPHSSSAWLNLNQVLVACGDDEIFQRLLSRFGSMGKRPQELLGYAVVERGQPWIAAFQRIAFATPGGKHHHKLAEILSPEIDDPTARSWIAADHDEVGWRVLIARHGEAILPELIDALPGSFADHHHIPALAHMRFLQQSPVSLLDELWSRIGSPMQPKAMQDLLNALATVHPVGIASIVRFIAERPDALPAYHLAQTLKLYEEWREKSRLELQVTLPNAETLPFTRWIVFYRALRPWEEHFTPRMLSSLPELAIEVVLRHLPDNDDKAAAVLNNVHGVESYHSELLSRMLASSQLAALIPRVFADCFDTFPAEALHRCISSPYIDQATLLFQLRSTSNPLHRSVHAEIMTRILDRPLDLHACRYIASMLRGHPRHDVLALLGSRLHAEEDSWLWLVREVETARGERLVDEFGRLRR